MRMKNWDVVLYEYSCHLFGLENGRRWVDNYWSFFLEGKIGRKGGMIYNIPGLGIPRHMDGDQGHM
jgi:hypothetical protein